MSPSLPLAATAAAVPLAAAALFLVAPATSAAPWTPPVTVGPAGMELYGAVSGASGTLAAGYGVRGGTDLVPVTPAGRGGRTRRAGTVIGVGAFADRAVFLRSSDGGRRVGLSVGDLGAGSLGHERVLHRGSSADASLAVGPGGQTLVALGVDGDEEDGDELQNERVRLTWSTDRRRRRWRSLPLPGRTDVLDMAVDARGTAILLLQRGQADETPVTARTLDLRRGRLGPERTLDRPNRDWLWGSIATDATGRAVLAWGAQDGGEEADRRMVVKAAFRRRGTDRFGAAQTLDPGGAIERTAGGPYAAMDGAGNATVAWSQTIDDPADPAGGETQSVPRASTAVADRPFGRFRTLLPQGTVGDAAATATTTLVAVTADARPAAEGGGASTPGVSGVLVREGAAELGTFEPVTGADPRDAEPLELTAGPAGFRAFWVRAGRGGRLRSAARPTG